MIRDELIAEISMRRDIPMEDVFKIDKFSPRITLNIQQFNMGNGTQSGVLPEKQQ